MSFINTLFRALIFTGIVFVLLSIFKNKGNSQDIKDNLIRSIPKDAILNSPPQIFNFILANIPAEKHSKVASLSAELATASSNWQPYKEEKIKELKLMIIDELYKTAIENIKK